MYPACVFLEANLGIGLITVGSIAPNTLEGMPYEVPGTMCRDRECLRHERRRPDSTAIELESASAINSARGS